MNLDDADEVRSKQTGDGGGSPGDQVAICLNLTLLNLAEEVMRRRNPENSRSVLRSMMIFHGELCIFTF